MSLSYGRPSLTESELGESDENPVALTTLWETGGVRCPKRKVLSKQEYSKDSQVLITLLKIIGNESCSLLTRGLVKQSQIILDVGGLLDECICCMSSLSLI